MFTFGVLGLSCEAPAERVCSNVWRRCLSPGCILQGSLENPDRDRKQQLGRVPSRGPMERMIKDIIQEAERWDFEPIPAGLWWV